MRLLDAADAQLFVSGSVDTPVDVICKSAGASPPSLYKHFGDKHGLLTAALRRRLEIWTQVWDEAIEAAAGPVERLVAVYPALRNYQAAHLPERWCAFSATTSATPEPSPALAAVLADERQLLRSRTAELVAAVVSDPAQADLLTRQLVTAYSGTIAMMLRESQEDAIDDGEATARALVEAALAVAR
ncbi:TetR/AcrR family transcriptional regulator [Actinomycetota bacterium]